MIHILVGILAAENLKAAFELDENLKGEILVLKDTLGIGPLKVEEGNSFRKLRTGFWKTIQPHFKEEVEDYKNVLLTLSMALQDEEPVCIWLAPCVSDWCAYYWLVSIFKPYPGILHTININSLPFLNEKGQLFYPNNFSHILPKEFVKTKRLLKEVTPSEYELDGDEWLRLLEENSMVRVYEGGKKIVSKEATQFDGLILNSAQTEFTKAQKLVTETLKKITQTVTDWFLLWRIRELIVEGKLIVQGDASKAAKDFEVKKPGAGQESIDSNSEEQTLGDSLAQS